MDVVRLSQQQTYTATIRKRRGPSLFVEIELVLSFPLMVLGSLWARIFLLCETTGKMYILQK
jgi:hypothetical protein